MTDYEDTINNSNSGGSDSGGDEGRKPFVMKGHLVQAELAKGEKEFGEIEWSRRKTEPPLEETQAPNYSEESSLAAANSNVVQSHPFLASQQFDGRDPIRDQRIPSMDDIERATNDPKLALSPELRMALENAKRHKMDSTPALKPAGL